MSVNYIINGDTLKDIADAIREKKETSALIDVSDFANEIRNIYVNYPDAEEVEF